MNKSELVNTIAQRTDLSAADVNKVINGFVDIVTEAVSTGGDKVAIQGFLTFERVERKARSGRNPRTGESMKIAASHAVKVTAGSKLKAAAKG